MIDDATDVLWYPKEISFALAFPKEISFALALQTLTKLSKGKLALEALTNPGGIKN
jgi:hypothetical protein